MGFWLSYLSSSVLWHHIVVQLSVDPIHLARLHYNNVDDDSCCDSNYNDNIELFDANVILMMKVTIIVEQLTSVGKNDDEKVPMKETSTQISTFSTND